MSPETDDPNEPLEEDEFEPFRESPVGTNDPNIVGDVGPFDTPPGRDPEPEGALSEDELEDDPDSIPE
jgi:hypothetical protein